MSSVQTIPDNYSERKRQDDAGAEIAQSIMLYREGDIELSELLALVTFHIPEATEEQVIQATKRRFDA